MLRLRFLGVMGALLLVAAALAAQTDEAASAYYVCMIENGANWIAGVSSHAQEGFAQHREHLRSLRDSGAWVMGGPFTDEGGGGMIIILADGSEKARALVEADPWVKADKLRVGGVRAWRPVVVEDSRAESAPVEIPARAHAARGDVDATQVPKAFGEERVLTKEVVVTATPEQVWHAWTTRDGIGSFFTPEAKVELRVGGPFELYMGMTEPDESGKRGSEGCRVLSYLPQEMLSFEWNFPPTVAGLRRSGAKTHVVLRFSEAVDGRTKVRFDQIGWQEGEDWDEGYAYFDRAWGWVLENLRKHFESESGSSDAAPERQVPDAKTWTEGAVTVTTTRAPIKRQDFEIVIPAPREQVWHALASTEGLRGQFDEQAVIELRPWGAYMTWPGAPNKVLSYVTLEMLSGTGSAPPQFPNVRKGGTWWVYRFDEIDDSHTRLRLALLGWHEHEGAEWNEAFDYFLTANAQYLNTLAERIAATGKRSVNDRVLRWEAVVDAPREEVWKAFTTKEGIESWMVPVAEVDFRIGGTIKTNYNPEAKIGDEGTIVHHILSFEPERMYTSRFTAPENAPVVKRVAEQSWGVIYFDELGPNQTRVRLSMCGWGEGEAWDAAEAFFQKGNARTLERLRQHFAGEPMGRADAAPGTRVSQP